MIRLLPVLFFMAASASMAQSAAGVTAEWDTRKLLDSLVLQTQHLRSVLGQVKTGGMIANGAPETYITQWNGAQTELKYLLTSIDMLAKQPERLPLALDALFRMQSMESTLGSVFEGIRKYQNPALAELLQGVVNENTTNRDRLRQYIQDLAIDKEKEFEVVDKEAQRCRANLLQAPPARDRKK